MCDKYYTLAEIKTTSIEIPSLEVLGRSSRHERKLWEAIEVLQGKLNEVIEDINCLHNLPLPISENERKPKNRKLTHPVGGVDEEENIA